MFVIWGEGFREGDGRVCDFGIGPGKVGFGVGRYGSNAGKRMGSGIGFGGRGRGRG